MINNLQREGKQLASLKKRNIAYFIDEIIISIIIFIIYQDQFSQQTDLGVYLNLVSSSFQSILLLKLIYHTFFTWQYGASPGKMICKIQCIDLIFLDKPSFVKSFARSLVRLFSEFIFYLGFFLAYSNELRQTLHDKAIKSVVIDVA